MLYQDNSEALKQRSLCKLCRKLGVGGVIFAGRPAMAWHWNSLGKKVHWKSWPGPFFLLGMTQNFSGHCALSFFLFASNPLDKLFRSLSLSLFLSPPPPLPPLSLILSYKYTLFLSSSISSSFPPLSVLFNGTPIPFFVPFLTGNPLRLLAIFFLPSILAAILSLALQLRGLRNRLD